MEPNPPFTPAAQLQRQLEDLDDFVGPLVGGRGRRDPVARAGNLQPRRINFDQVPGQVGPQRMAQS